MNDALQTIYAVFGIEFDRGGDLARGDQQVKGLIDTLGRLGVAVSAGFAVRAVRDFVTETVRLGSEIDDTSQVLGISAGELQQWQYVARLSGAEANEFTGAFVRMQNRMAQGGAGAEVFRRLGVDIRNADGSLRNASDVLTDLADPIAAIGSDAERTGVLVDLLGRSGARLGPLFARGREGIAQVTDEFQRLGGGLSDEAVQGAAEAGDALDRLDVTLTTMRGQIAIFVLPIVEALANAFAFTAANSHILEGAVTAAGVGLVAVAHATVASWGPVALTMLRSLAPLILIGLAVDDVITLMRGGRSVIGDFLDMIEPGAALATTTALRDAWTAIRDLIREAGQYWAEFFGQTDTAIGGRTASGEVRLATRDLQAPGSAAPAQTIFSASDSLTALASFGSRELPGRLTDPLAWGTMRALAGQAANAATSGGRAPITIGTINANGLRPAEVEGVVRRAIEQRERASAADTLDALAGGAS